jgi:hypothetical protein
MAVKEENAIKKLREVPGIGSVNPSPSGLLCTHVNHRRDKAEALYDAGCDTIAKLHLKKYKETLTPVSIMGLKYFDYLQRPVPRENVNTIVVRHFFPHALRPKGPRRP